jgi:predicted MFS family arabinose efflux permease
MSDVTIRARVAAPFEPLGTPAYRRFLAASIIASICSWIFYTAQTWNFLESSGTAAAVAYLPLVLVVPVPLALIVGGTFTDRRGPKATLVVAQLAMALTMGCVGLLDAAGILSFWPTLFTGFLLGVCSGLSNVPGQALLLRIVDKPLLAKAFGLNLVTVGIGRFVGGPIGGAVVQSAGAMPAFAIAAAGTLLAALIYFTLPRAEPLETSGPRISRQDLSDAFGWIRRTPAAVALIAVDATMAGLVYPYTAIVPVIARDVIGGGAVVLGVLVSAGGVGAIAGGLVLAPAARRFGQGRLLLAGVTTAGCGIALLGLSGSIVASSAVAALVGGSSIGSSVTSGLLLQTMSPPRLRGRVLAFDSVVFNLVNPVAVLVLGLAVDRVGPTPVLLAMGVLTALSVTTIATAHRPVLHLDVDAGGEVASRRVRPTPVPTEAPGTG